MQFEHEGLARRLTAKFNKKIHTYQDWEDTLQETRIMILEAEKEYNSDKSKFTTFCFTTVYRDLLNYFESSTIRNYKKYIGLTKEDYLDYRSCDPNQDKFVCVKQIYNGLNNKQKKLITMHLLGYENKEIGKKEGCSGENIRQKLNVIKKNIKKENTLDLCEVR